MKTTGYILQAFGVLTGIAAVVLSLFFGIVTAVDASTAGGMAAGIILAFFCESIGAIVGMLFWLPGRALTDAAKEVEMRKRLVSRNRRHR